MRYYIINEKTHKWTLINFRCELLVDTFKKMYPTLKFVVKDETLHGSKMRLDPMNYEKYLDGVREE